MNYKIIYNTIIEKSRKENRIRLQKNDNKYVYYEEHHILPKCLGGSEEKTNKILLTAKEHYICHKLLTYIYPNNSKLYAAFSFMSFNKNSKHKISSRDYSYARELCSRNYTEYNKINKKGKSYKQQMIEMYGEEIGLKKSEKYIEKIRKNTKGNNNPMFAKGFLISGKNNGMFGKPSTMRGVKRTEESKRKMSEAKIGIKRHLHLCLYCNRKISDGNYERWHGNNCKLKNKN
jgi:hypothetical protein